MNNAYTVSDLNKIVKVYLEGNLNLKNLMIEGEVSNLTYHPSGHLYFSLKDNLSSVKCIAFNYKSKIIDNNIKNGQMIKVLARVTLYEVSGQYQLLCESIRRKEQIGKEHEKLRLLKEKLMKLGYFNYERKRDIPLAFNVGIVTSEKGAVLRDIIVTSRKKFENINIFAFPAKVQGEDAKYTIVHGIELLNSIDDIDLIIIGRGGGTLEDLNAFNTEEIANAIFRSKKPIISAVGHETDFVISDYVADKRASTPTQAADIATPNKDALKNLLISKTEKLNKHLINFISSLRYQLTIKKNNYILRSLPEVISQHRIDLSELLENLKNPIEKIIEENREKLKFLKYILEKIASNLLEDMKKSLFYRVDILKTLNPMNVLLRGYAIVKIKEHFVNSIDDIKKDEVVTIKLWNGQFKSKII